AEDVWAGVALATNSPMEAASVRIGFIPVPIPAGDGLLWDCRVGGDSSSLAAAPSVAPANRQASADAVRRRHRVVSGLAIRRARRHGCQHGSIAHELRNDPLLPAGR